jgi:hypothetical protein
MEYFLSGDSIKSFGIAREKNKKEATNDKYNFIIYPFKHQNSPTIPCGIAGENTMKNNRNL